MARGELGRGFLLNARAKGKRLGRPRLTVDARRVAMLRKGGATCTTICRETGLSKGTVKRAVHSLPKNPLRAVSTTGSESVVQQA